MKKNRKKTADRGKASKVRPRSESRKRKSEPEEKVKTKPLTVLKGFTELWENLFSSPVHLDSALSKQTPSTKSILAQILPTILLRPVSQAEALGVGVPFGEPWNLDMKKMAHWRPAQLMAERMYEMMVRRGPDVEPVAEDFPTKMMEEWKTSWPAEVVQDLVEVLGKEAPLSLRVSRRVGAQAVLQGLTSNSRLPVRAEISKISPLGIRLSGYAPVLNTEWYEKGAFEIQDEGSQLMALFALWPERYGPLLRAQPGRIQPLELLAPPPPKDPQAWTVIDTCSGAGGKTLAIADAMKGKGRVFAYDTSAVKLQALRRRATHAQLNNIQTATIKNGFEAEIVDRFKNTAQVVLVDAPCTGWGVLRRNPDIKWRQDPLALQRLPELQARLLQSYSELVAPGGRLIYGVCTFRMAETTEIISNFLKKNPKFKSQQGGFLGPGPCDGFFMQAMVRES